jgi:hypothetical protein
MGNTSSNPGRSANLPAGYDEEDPYEGEDLESYPKWWRENIEEFKEHNMRPYRPPRFADGTLVPELANELEERYGVEIKFQNRTPKRTDEDGPHEPLDWDVVLDGERISTVPRYRAPEGYSVYDVEAEAFEELIREHAV